MLIKKHGKYKIISKGPDQLIHEWNLTIAPSKRAWKLVNLDIEPGDILNGYAIISIVKICEPKIYESSFEDVLSISSISEAEFNFAVSTSGIDYAVAPYFGQSYSCDLCGGIVANDICTSCRFDWDSY